MEALHREKLSNLSAQIYLGRVVCVSQVEDKYVPVVFQGLITTTSSEWANMKRHGYSFIYERVDRSIGLQGKYPVFTSHTFLSDTDGEFVIRFLCQLATCVSDTFERVSLPVVSNVRKVEELRSLLRYSHAQAVQ
jgi:hypothetical protein